MVEDGQRDSLLSLVESYIRDQFLSVITEDKKFVRNVYNGFR